MKQEKISKLAMVTAAFHKLKWLREHFDPGQINDVSFHKLVYDLLSLDCRYKPELVEYGLEYPMITQAALGRKILLFSKEGKLIGQVGMKQLPGQKNVPARFLFWTWAYDISDRILLFQETVGEALKRLDPQDQTYFIVGIMEENGKTELAITKPAHGDSTKATLEAEMVVAESKVAEALA